MTVDFILYCSDDGINQPQLDPEGVAELEEEPGTNAECMKNVDKEITCIAVLYELIIHNSTVMWIIQYSYTE